MKRTSTVLLDTRGDYSPDVCDLLQTELKEYDKTSKFEAYLIVADCGLWNGRRRGYNVAKTLQESLEIACSGMDGVIVKDEGGRFVVTGIHHDGSNICTIFGVHHFPASVSGCDLLDKGLAIMSTPTGLRRYCRRLNFAKTIYGA